LDKFSKEKSDELKIVIPDNGAFHKAKKLVIPENTALIFLPPYARNSILLKKFGGYSRRRHQHESIPKHKRFAARTGQDYSQASYGASHSVHNGKFILYQQFYEPFLISNLHKNKALPYTSHLTRQNINPSLTEFIGWSLLTVGSMADDYSRQGRFHFRSQPVFQRGLSPAD
jgi:hypothetical protein